ncbi:hypothetical protein [Heyndrickxia coagulans]|uniref:Uncharacterized protein n=1 Tax=Heyndrickxia coagulans TaxID=1398 RepID=A0A133KGT1_HEYCO|nr:hypothetical protein [Heyndrickxia coagulans]KWZ78736.1 hypothetical protein HMPREF3213_02922 [Heyndrickxia coagulans]
MKKQQEKPLFSVPPPLYHTFMQTFELHHIHLYDADPAGVEKENGIEVVLRYGDRFQHETRKCFSFSDIENKAPEVAEFFKQAAESCKEVLIADYYKMMKS